MRFEWHPVKALSNFRKHNVSFEEAASVFQDESSYTFYDSDHSNDEERLITIGFSNQANLLFISHTEHDDLIRIISARKANRREREEYGN